MRDCYSIGVLQRAYAAVAFDAEEVFRIQTARSFTRS